MERGPLFMRAQAALAEPGSVEAGLLKKIDSAQLPRHVAVIMDGNGRWAHQRRLPRVAGHRAGIDSVREIIEVAARLGLEVLTLYAFSVENWKRPQSEVRTLMGLLKEYIRRELDRLADANIRFLAIGRVSELAPSVRRELDRAIERTHGNTGMRLIVALNYGGRAELVDAFTRLSERQEGKLVPVTEELIAKFLYTAGIPDPDLLIRTSGEMRLSNFLLWQIAYSEIYVTSTYWPDFRRKHFFEAILDYQKRDRRYGGIRDGARR
jgi:undecaprenyl diphosphate synthase